MDTTTLRERTAPMAGEGRPRPMHENLIEAFRAYAVQHPERAALWCLGIGFVLGWKLKPW